MRNKKDPEVAGSQRQPSSSQVNGIGSVPALASSGPQVTQATAKISEDIEQSEPDIRAEEEGDAEVGTFETQLTRALEEAFPLLLDRLQRALFADRHRRMDLMLDLAQGAALAVLGHCRQKRYIPNDLVGYLVTTARNLAIKDWKSRRAGPASFVDLEKLSAGHSVAGRLQPGIRVGADEEEIPVEGDADQPDDITEDAYFEDVQPWPGDEENDEFSDRDKGPLAGALYRS